MGENLLAGIGDAYWYEWYVGLEKVLDLLNPDIGVVGVTLQASQQQGLDDVVVRYNDKKLECIQVKHTRKDSTLSYSFLFCEHTENGKKHQHVLRNIVTIGKKSRISTSNVFRLCILIEKLAIEVIPLQMEKVIRDHH